MLANELYGLKKDLRERGIVFAYSGYVTENVLSGVGDALKKKLAIEDADTKTIRSVFAVFVEQMQNIIRYSVEQLPSPDLPPSADHPAELRYGILTIGQEGADYVVHAGNLVMKSDVPRMRERLSAIQAMNREQLKFAYKEQLRSGPDEHSKGAGIGFIEIARRASSPIEFDFMDIDGKLAFFALKATI
ncbi:hypothetical protein GR183_09215 [Stappia sp. GBMRC 2046]|uniref:Uncharacterized protein n=1 Tax=Stappia sediminis TaxID=2692190 RepID=A0A7X3S7U2_9HYPH|nr:SiaB family protein kinase [Stappia sediminis]MXN65085.1 hypothetical protein [Stappia sediminis]